MRELSLHVMDIVENGLTAGGSRIDIFVMEDSLRNQLSITIGDNGKGMSDSEIQKVLDPFYTTRKTRRVGLGLSMLRETSRRCDGEFSIKSQEGRGTQVQATFKLNHIDLPPLGDMAGSLISLIMGNPDADFVYTHEVDGNHYCLDTRIIKKELEEVPINSPEIIKYLSGIIEEALKEIKAGKAAVL